MLIILHLGLRGVYVPLEIVGESRLSPPVIGIGGLREGARPAFCEVPVYAPWIDGLLQVRVGGAGAGDLVQDLHFGAVDFDVGWVGAVSWVVGVRAAYVGHFDDHVWCVGFGPHGYADVL